MRGVPCPAFLDGAGELDDRDVAVMVRGGVETAAGLGRLEMAVHSGNRRGSAALRHYVACAGFALAALRGDAELELDVIEAQACTDMARDFAVGNPVAYTDDHGGKRNSWLLKMSDYKYESIAFAMAIAMSRPAQG